MAEDPAVDAIARRLTVPELVAVYEQAERDIRRGFELVHEAEERLRVAFQTDGAWIRSRDRWGQVNFSDPDGAIETVQRECWRTLVSHLEIRRFCSVKAWQDLSRQLQDGEMPPLTLENAERVLKGFRDQIPDMLEAMVEEVFNLLRPRTDRYKTNSQFEVPERVVLECMIDKPHSNDPVWRRTWTPSPYVGTHHSAETDLAAIERVFQALDGQGVIGKDHHSRLSTAIKASGRAGKGSTEYFEFRAFMNGNLHLRFKRGDLLARLNQIAGGKRLRGERKSKS